MDSRDRRAREIQHAIEEVLLRDWNPIGACNNQRATDEYACYVAGVYRLLIRGASVPELAEHLAQKEQQQMGFTTPPEKLRDVAAKLRALDVGLEPGQGPGAADEGEERE